MRSYPLPLLMVVYLPAHRLLHASDLVQWQPDGAAASPQYLSEVVDLVERHRLAVDSVFAMHANPVAWDAVRQAVACAWGGHRSP